MTNKEKKSSSSNRHFMCGLSFFLNDSTIITRNNDIFTVIKIDIIKSDGEDVRNILRKIISDSSDNFMFQLYSCRGASKFIHNDNDINYDYNIINIIKKQFCNQYEAKDISVFKTEFFIVIGLKADIIERSMFHYYAFSFLPKILHDKIEKKVVIAQNLLVVFAKNIVEKLDRFSPAILGRDKINSEILEFLSFIFIGNKSLLSSVYPERNIAKYLFDSIKLKFGFDVFSVEIGKKLQYATILTIKNYTDIPIDDINHILSLEVSFYIAETVIPTLLKKEREYKSIIDILNIFKSSKNDEFTEHFSHEEYSQSKLCSHSINFVLFADNTEILIDNIIKITDILDTLGIISVRQDIGLEQIFWGSTPVNQNRLYHSFVAKKNKAGLFIGNSESFDNTNNKENILFFTHENKLFLLNISNRYPIFIISPSKLMRTMLCNFLLLFYYEYNKKTYIFEIFGESELFVRSMGGVYYEEKQPVNPFIYGTKDMMINIIFALASHLFTNKQKIVNIIDEILKIPKEKRCHANIVEILEPHKLTNVISFLSANDVDYNDIIDYESFYNNDSKIIGFNLAGLYKNPNNALFMMIYLIEGFFTQHDGTSMTIVISDISIFGKILFNNPRYFKIIMNKARELNIKFIFNISDIEFINQVSDIMSYIFSIDWRLFIFSSSIIKLSMKFCETFLLLSNEINLIREMQKNNHCHFFFKEGKSSEFLEFKYQEVDCIDLLYTSKEQKEKINKIDGKNLSANEIFNHFYKNKESV